MAEGKIYNSLDSELLGCVEYQFFDSSSSGWWGELVFTEYRKTRDGDGYILELEDGRRGHCSLKKKLNKAVSGIPPLFYYRFQGLSTLG